MSLSLIGTKIYYFIKPLSDTCNKNILIISLGLATMVGAYIYICVNINEYFLTFMFPCRCLLNSSTFASLLSREKNLPKRNLWIFLCQEDPHLPLFFLPICWVIFEYTLKFIREQLFILHRWYPYDHQNLIKFMNELLEVFINLQTSILYWTITDQTDARKVNRNSTIVTCLIKGLTGTWRDWRTIAFHINSHIPSSIFYFSVHML